MAARPRRWFNALACCMCAAIITGLILCAIFAHKIVTLKVYRHLVSPPLEFDTALGVPAVGVDPDIYISQCTNSTGSDIPIKFSNHDKLVISYLCPQTKNQCEINVCNSDYTCEKALTTGECSEDTECYSAYGPTFFCNTTTCSCQRECLASLTCPVLNSTCSSYVCNGTNACVEELNPGAACSTSDQCFAQFGDSAYKCNQTTCSCEFNSPFGSNMSCLVDTDCPLTNTICSEYDCVDGTCTEVLVPGATCSYSESCATAANNSYYACSWSTCQCIFSPSMEINHTCTVDADCPLPLNSCTSFICSSNFCVEQLVVNATCSADAQCGSSNNTDYYCDLTTCACASRAYVFPGVMFLSRDNNYVNDTHNATVSFNITQESVGDVFYSHATPSWTAVNVTDPTAYYLIFFRVQFFMGILETDAYLIPTGGIFPDDIIPGCYGAGYSFGSSSSNLYNIIINGHCMIYGGNYTTTGIELQLHSVAASQGALNPTDYSAWIIMQKLN